MQFSLQKAAYTLIIIVLFFTIIIYAKSFLVPVCFAAILAMLLLPLTQILEDRGLPKAFATVAAVLLILIILSALIFFVRWQIGNIVSDADKIEQEVIGRYHQLRNFIANNFGISVRQQEQIIREQGKDAGSGLGSILTNTAGSLGTFITDFILVLVYIFLFIFYRKHIKEFFFRMVPVDQRDATESMLYHTQQVAQKYLGGMSLMIVGLWVMYGIGFSISGVENALFFAILCGILEIVPFIGNLTGTALTLLMVLAQGGGTGMVLGVIITYGLVQFIQSYLLEPLIVGAGVRINPLFTILALVAGEFVWGIPGMVLALPMTGILKIIMDHVKPLKPLGFLLGETANGETRKQRAQSKKQ